MGLFSLERRSHTGSLATAEGPIVAALARAVSSGPSRAVLVVAAVMALTACSEPEHVETDAALAVDAGARADGGGDHDGGPEIDGGREVDGGRDVDAGGAATLRCRSDRLASTDPSCANSPSSIIVFRDALPGGVFSARVTPPDTRSIPLDGCTGVLDATPPCVCDPGLYCHSDGTCNTTPEDPGRDVGPIDILVGGLRLGHLEYVERGQVYAAADDFPAGATVFWEANDVVEARGARFAISGLAPTPIVVSSFEHVLLQTARVREDLALRWNAGEDDQVVELSFGLAGAYARCAARDDGEFTIPWTLIDAIFQANGGPGEFLVNADRVRRSAWSTSEGDVDLVILSREAQSFTFAP